MLRVESDSKITKDTHKAVIIHSETRDVCQTVCTPEQHVVRNTWEIEYMHDITW